MYEYTTKIGSDAVEQRHGALQRMYVFLSTLQVADVTDPYTYVSHSAQYIVQIEFEREPILTEYTL